MRTLLVLISLLASFITCASAETPPPIEISFQRTKGADILVINGAPLSSNRDFAVVKKQIEALKIPEDSKSTRVTLLDLPPNKPKLPNFTQLQLFAYYTSPDREVTYFYKGHKVRRYRIVCSSKGTAEHYHTVNYWLDGELLGTWEKAKLRFDAVKWEENAVVDFQFDLQDMLTSSGSVFALDHHLASLFEQHRILANIGYRYRSRDDR